MPMGVRADKILVRDGVMLLSNIVNCNLTASSACIASSFRHDICVCGKPNRPNRCAVIEVAILGIVKNVQLQHVPRAVVGKTRNGYYTTQLLRPSTFSKKDRLSIGCPVPEISGFEEPANGRPAAHTQIFSVAMLYR